MITALNAHKKMKAKPENEDEDSYVNDIKAMLSVADHG